eukprot:GGOE01014180.1.p1 GENE.GGOE01014180.1~~GGOE01014180.1.p1  ORF type:complete len:485 (+),score=91.67 GGOE01014180.1:92-1546(+)
MSGEAASEATLTEGIPRYKPVTASYSGGVQDGKRHGCGMYIYRNLAFHYEGDWEDNLKHGHGTFTVGDSIYEGDFQHGEMTGKGRRVWGSGATYCGYFLQGEMHGDGEYVAADGTKYEGQWCWNKRHGQGKLLSPDGQHYEGSFYNHKPHGLGVLQLPNGDVLRGTFEGGVLHGTGSIVNAQGDEYTGTFQNGRMHGMGKWTSRKSGCVFEGKWECDRPQEAASRLILQRVCADSSELKSGDGHCQISLTQELRMFIACGRVSWSVVPQEEVESPKRKPLSRVQSHTSQADTTVEVVTLLNNESGRHLSLTLWQVPVEKEDKDKDKGRRAKPDSTKGLSVSQAPRTSPSGTSWPGLPPTAEQARFLAARIPQSTQPASRASSRGRTPLSGQRRATPTTKQRANQPKVVETVRPPTPEPPEESLLQHIARMENGLALFPNVLLSRTFLDSGNYAFLFEDISPLDTDPRSPFAHHLEPATLFFNLN